MLPGAGDAVGALLLHATAAVITSNNAGSGNRLSLAQLVFSLRNKMKSPSLNQVFGGRKSLVLFAHRIHVSTMDLTILNVDWSDISCYVRRRE